jgi:hypothetical protein
VIATIADGRLRLDYAQNRYGVAKVLVHATDSHGLWVEDYFSVTVNSVNDPPVIDTLAAAPDTVKHGQSFTLTAGGADDPHDSGGTVVTVAFYRESNGTPGLQTGSGGDTLVGLDDNALDGWAVNVSLGDLPAGTYTYYAQATDNEGGVSAADSGAVATTGTVLAESPLDVDGNAALDALTDGILILRYLFDPAGPWNFSDSLGSGATRTTREEIRCFLDGGRTAALDVDGNGAADALTDGILILRYLFDPAGAWNCSDALGSGATRTTRTEIKAFLDAYNPSLASASTNAPNIAPCAGSANATVLDASLASGAAIELPETLDVASEETAVGGLTDAPATTPSALVDEVLRPCGDDSLRAFSLCSLDTRVASETVSHAWFAWAARLARLRRVSAVDSLWTDDSCDSWLPLRR